MQMMAEQEEKLACELRNIFPMAPDWVLADTIRKCNKSRDQCILRLRHEGYTPNPNPQNSPPPPPYASIVPHVPRLSLQCENGGKKTRFTFVPPQDAPPAYPAPGSQSLHHHHHTETQQMRMTVSYNQTRRMGVVQPPVAPPRGVPVPENGVITHSEGIRHKTSVNFTPVLPPAFDESSSSTSPKISSINVYIDPPTYQQRPPVLMGGAARRRELRPAPAPPTKSPSPSSPTTPTAARRRAPPRPPPPVVGAWRQSPSPSPSPTAVTLFEGKDPEQDNVSHKPMQPTVSPSTDSNKTLLDFAQHDEPGYIQALLLHQREKLEHFRLEYQKEKSVLESKRMQIFVAEQEQYERRRRNRTHSLTSLEELQKLREENQRLRFECDCMTREVDFLHKGQVPLGETSEEFYESIHTGQAGLVLPGPSSSQSFAWVSPTEVRRPSVTANGRGCDEEANKWSCSRCTFCNDSALDLCEICGMLRFGRVTPATAAGRG